MLYQNSVKSYVPEAEGLFAVDFSWERIVQPDFCRRHVAAGLHISAAAAAGGRSIGSWARPQQRARAETRAWKLWILFSVWVSSSTCSSFVHRPVPALFRSLSPGTAATGADACSEPWKGWDSSVGWCVLSHRKLNLHCLNRRPVRQFAV